MDTYMTITAYGSNSEKAIKEAETEINHLDDLFAKDKVQSEVYKLNNKHELSASDDTKEILTRAVEISELTDGDFDITIAPVVAEWGFYSDLENKVPTQQDLKNALSRVDYKNISIGEMVETYEATEIDLGGIAKGYASYKAMEIIKSNDVDSAIISLGGNVRAVGSKPDGSAWTVAIADPDDATKNIGALQIKDRAVITSGGYQRYFEDNGQIYHHIIDTKTGYPAKRGLKSVTVVCEDDTLADALSTALFVKGLDESIEFYRKNQSFEAVFITDSGEIFVTPDISESFKSDRNFEVIDI